MHKINLLILLLISGLAASPVRAGPTENCSIPPPDASGYNVIGDAYDESGNLIYSEHLVYQHADDGGQLTTLYSLPNNTPLAIKEVDFLCNPTAPSFVLTDLETGYVEGVQWIADENHVFSYQGENKEKLEVPDGISIFDAGFDNTIKLHWDSLISGKSLKVNYLFARDNKFLTLRLKKSKLPKGIDVSPNPGEVFFKISANNLIFRLLSSPLFVGYDQETRTLKYYAGPSNLPMMEEEKEILIRYRNSESLTTQQES